MDLEKKVLEFAKKAHGSQVRKYTGEPYWHHLVEVAELVKTVKHTETMVYGALLHDTLEDTPTTEEDIFKFLTESGLSEADAKITVNIVLGLTDVSKLSDGNRAIRKALDREHTSKQDKNIKTIKLADIISNVKSIAKHDRGFARKYIPENALLLEVLKEGDQQLYTQARDLIVKAVKELKL